MDEIFKIEIISPEKIFFSSETIMTTLPSYEGEIGILKDHISLLTFLRPGIIKVKQKGENNENFFIDDGVVEFSDNKLIILSTSVINIKNLNKNTIDNLIKEANSKLNSPNLKDEEKYLLNHKLDTIKNINFN